MPNWFKIDALMGEMVTSAAKLKLAQGKSRLTSVPLIEREFPLRGSALRAPAHQQMEPLSHRLPVGSGSWLKSPRKKLLGLPLQIHPKNEKLDFITANLGSRRMQIGSNLRINIGQNRQQRNKPIRENSITGHRTYT